MFKKIVFFPLFIMLTFSNAYSSMTISGTRVVFPGSEKEKSVRTNNKGSQPALVQVWVDDGSVTADVNNMKVPFIVTPPVYRVEPGKGQNIRMIYNGMALPQDRESVFWFNMLEVPPVQKSAEKSDRLELAFRTRIKIFYRPETLTSSSSAELDKLQWELLPDNKGVKLTNPTPYYISLESVSVKAAGKNVELESEMVPPFSSKNFTQKNKTPVNGITAASFTLFNDYGAAVNGTLKVTPERTLLLQSEK